MIYHDKSRNVTKTETFQGKTIRDQISKANSIRLRKYDSRPHPLHLGNKKAPSYLSVCNLIGIVVPFTMLDGKIPAFNVLKTESNIKFSTGTKQ